MTGPSPFVAFITLATSVAPPLPPPPPPDGTWEWLRVSQAAQCARHLVMFLAVTTLRGVRVSGMECSRLWPAPTRIKRGRATVWYERWCSVAPARGISNDLVPSAPPRKTRAVACAASLASLKGWEHAALAAVRSLWRGGLAKSFRGAVGFRFEARLQGVHKHQRHQRANAE